MILKTILLALVLAIQTTAVQAQTTEFTYQGNLNNGAAPATGNYDFEFALFSAVTAGSQLGATVTVSNVDLPDVPWPLVVSEKFRFRQPGF